MPRLPFTSIMAVKKPVRSVHEEPGHNSSNTSVHTVRPLTSDQPTLVATREALKMTHSTEDVRALAASVWWLRSPVDCVNVTVASWGFTKQLITKSAGWDHLRLYFEQSQGGWLTGMTGHGAFIYLLPCPVRALASPCAGSEALCQLTASALRFLLCQFRGHKTQLWLELQLLPLISSSSVLGLSYFFCESGNSQKT